MPGPMLFSPLDLRSVRLKNRVVVAPMHQYSAVYGFATDWHLVNAGKFAAGGAGLVMMESTKVERRGCGTIGDLGLWKDEFVAPLRRIVDFIKSHGAVAGIQIGHSGRKAKLQRPWEGSKPLLTNPGLDEADWEAWELVGPSALPASESGPVPRALTTAEVGELVQAWGAAARRANEAGFDVLEIHAAHGYLIHEFLSPHANRRNDQYGGSEENRMRFAVEVVECVRSIWPEHKPLFMRFSVEDDMGWGPAQSVALAQLVQPKGVDVIDCSSGGMTQRSSMESKRAITYGYQVPYAEQIRREADIKTMAVGLIIHADQAESILQKGQADLIALAREILYNPNWPMDAAQKLGVDPTFASIPPQSAYWLARRAQSGFGGKPSTWGAGIEAKSN